MTVLRDFSSISGPNHGAAYNWKQKDSKQNHNWSKCELTAACAKLEDCLPPQIDQRAAVPHWVWIWFGLFILFPLPIWRNSWWLPNLFSS